MLDRHLFTSESVTEGHPDKVADAISDAILDAILKDDPLARVACETLVTTGLACVAGEITTKTYVNVPEIVRSTIDRIGYNDTAFGFDSKTCAVISTIEAAMAVPSRHLTAPRTRNHFGPYLISTIPIPARSRSTPQ